MSINLEKIEYQWSKINTEKVENGLYSIRISAESIPELFLGIDKIGSRNLILSIPRPYEFRFKGSEKENLSIDFFRESNHIVVKLENPSFNDLFNDLILSLYNKISWMSNTEEYGKEFIQTFHRWSGFFSNLSSTGLSEDTLKGIFGELILLRNMLRNSDSLTVNSILESWKGPYDAVNDFESDLACIEVKTKENSKPQVRISSEFQLATKPDKTLSLCIVSVVTDPIDGISISDLISQVRELIWERDGDMTILINALAKKGLISDYISTYDHFKLSPLKLSFYDCEPNHFPKITPKTLSPSISKVSYEIRLSEIEEFMISETIL